MTELSTTTTNNNNTDSKGTVLSSTPPAAAAALNSPTVTPTTPVSVDQQLLAINNQLRAQLLASALKSSLMGAAAGFGVGFLLFKRRLFPMWLGMGFGLGKTYGEAGRLLTMAHDELLRCLEDSREEQQQQKTQN